MTSPAPCLEIELPSRTELVTVVRMLVAAGAKASGALHGTRLDDLTWVVSEAVTNAIHANNRRGDHHRVSVRACFEPDVVRLTVVDQGPGMSDTREIPSMEDPSRLEIEGGFGIPLMQSLASAPLEFRTDTGGTSVEIRVAQR